MNGDTQGRPTAGTTQSNFWMQMFYLPITIFMTTVDALGRMMGASQRTGGGRMGTSSPGGAVSSAPNISAGISTNFPGASAAAAISTKNETRIQSKEGSMGADNQDLSGEDVKTVVYSILFTKRDVEATLKSLTEDVVNYSTNAASYGGLQLANFTATGKFDRPQSWKENNYPSPNFKKDKDLTVEDIPPGDRRYITIDFKVVSRFSKNDADYQKRQTIALEDIAVNTKSLEKL
jgi:hypothetical protein